MIPMLSPEDNDLLCRVGPGSPMGDLMRQYWIPALTSDELPEPDCPPLRVRLLGENLIAFRATSGRVGLIQDACMHRGASLFFGRNEEEGLRCVYHGWKYDHSGQCVDMPNEPTESNFKSRIRATAYPCFERRGVVFTYMGPRAADDLPPLPDLEPNLLPDGEWTVQKIFRECNWVQGMEGDIDTSHLGFLHLGAVQKEQLTPGGFDYYAVADRAPRYQVVDSEVGTSYGAYRPAEANTTYWRIAHFLFPFWTMIPTGVLGEQILVRAWVPLDDEHMMFWSLGSRRTLNFGSRPVEGSGNSVLASRAPVPGRAPVMEFLPDTSDWLGRARLRQNRGNDYLIDRDAQRRGSYSGIEGIHQQDQAITESMGGIYDRSNEHLGTSDAMIVRTRQRLMASARALRDQAAVPPGVDHPDHYRLRSGGVILPNGINALEATKDLQTAFAGK
jgi:nitrite reductase/ring-hydroxylating ferredoxin subunit